MLQSRENSLQRDIVGEYTREGKNENRCRRRRREYGMREGADLEKKEETL